MVNITHDLIHIDAPKARIVQHEKRRFSIRLELVFWRALERAAAERGVRLGRLVAQLADGYDGSNFSSYLRTICMAAAENGMARADLAPTAASLIDTVAACPTAGLVISAEQIILAHNQAMSAWLGGGHPRLIQAPFQSLFHLRPPEAPRDLLAAAKDARMASRRAQLLYIVPGRMSAAGAHVLALHGARPDRIYVVIWLSAIGARLAPARRADRVV